MHQNRLPEFDSTKVASPRRQQITTQSIVTSSRTLPKFGPTSQVVVEMSPGKLDYREPSSQPSTQYRKQQLPLRLGSPSSSDRYASPEFGCDQLVVIIACTTPPSPRIASQRRILGSKYHQPSDCESTLIAKYRSSTIPRRSSSNEHWPT